MDLQKESRRKRFSGAREACFPKFTLNLWLSSLQRFVRSPHLGCVLLREDPLQVESLSLWFGVFIMNLAISERMDSESHKFLKPLMKIIDKL